MIIVALTFGVDNGDFFSELLRSRPLPSTAFRSEPLRLRADLLCASDIALRPLGEPRSVLSLSLFSPSLVRKMFRRERRLPEIERL